MDRLEAWFAERGWVAFPFQRETWGAYLAGASGLVHAPTGTGKTLAVWGGPLIEGVREREARAMSDVDDDTPPPLKVLWITPMRALANDTASALAQPITELGLNWTVGLRTGDTGSHERKKQRGKLPTALVTTPESLSVMLSYADHERLFRHLKCVIVDEWHELLGTKRGVQAELGLAALRSIAPGLRVWGLSATLGNLEEAKETLLGPTFDPARTRLVHAAPPKEIEIQTLRPPDIERFPWAGHLGTRLLPEVLEALRRARTTLVFTNTRSQAEIWFRSIVRSGPEWAGEVGLHHGSLDREVRREVEERLRAGRLKAVVCTSSLDLGVDFSPVEQVIQVGSPKGIARLLQRAGRSGHRPGAVSRVLGVPTNALELIEFAAARDALARREVESRRPLDRPLDVLVQHLVTSALGGGFDDSDLYEEVRTTRAFSNLSREEWRWCLDFVTRGGSALQSYPQFQRVDVDEDGRFVVRNRRIASMHRMSIGTITSDATMHVALVSGKSLGTIEESFIARLKAGDRFVFAGRTLELVRVKEMTAQVKPAKARSGSVPRWQGGKSPLSTQLADAVARKIEAAKAGRYEDAEMRAIEPLLRLQEAMSILPEPGELLIETTKSRDGFHAFVYPLQGRLVHEGLAALVAYRLTRAKPFSVGVSGTDWGFELLARKELPGEEAAWRALLSTERLVEDLLACANTVELARRQFREIARVAGLIFPGYPGQAKRTRHLQASSSLFFEVFREYEPGNLLLDQARREVLDRELEVTRLRRGLEALAEKRIMIVETKPFTPLAFPIFADRLRSQHVTSESWSVRIRELVDRLEARAPATEGVEVHAD